MTLDDFICGIASFEELTASDKIRTFAWYIHVHRSLQYFKTVDITMCFDQLHLPRPSNPSRLLLNLVEQKQLLSDRNGFRLAKSLRDKLDVMHGARAETILVDKLLSGLPAKLLGLDQEGYMEEALICFRNRAFRAAIVMTWNVAYDHLVSTILDRHLVRFNTQMSSMFGGKKKDVHGREDFQRLKESEVVEVCNAGGLVAKEVAKVLSDKLDKRNSAAHPSGSSFDKLQTEAYISDLINNAVLKIR